MTLPSLQVALLEVLARDPWLKKRDVAVLAEDKGNIIAEVDTKVQQLGLVAVITTPGLRGDAPDSPEATGNSDVYITCFENPLLNRNKANRTTALNAAERIACVLTALTQLKDTTTGEMFGVPEFVAIESGVVEHKSKSLLVYNIIVRIRVVLKGDMDKEPPHHHQPQD